MPVKTHNNKHQSNLLILTPFFHPHTGGVEKHVLKTALLLQKQGWQITIITRQHDSNLPTQEKTKDLTVLRFQFPEIKYFGLLMIWLKLLAQFTKQFHRAKVIHVHDVMIWCLPLRLLFPRKRFVLTVHGWEGIYPIPKTNIWLKKLSVLLANKVVCVGAYINKHYGINCDAVIEGAVDFAEYSLGNITHTSSKPKTNKLIYLGRLSPDTALPMLFSVWNQLAPNKQNNLELVFIGSGELLNKCRQCGRVLTNLSEQQIIQQLQSAQLFFAGGYLSAYEALAAGCTVVAGANSPVKKDYWQMSEAGKKVSLVETDKELLQVLTAPKKVLNVESTNRDLAWVKQQGWEKITRLYTGFYSS